ncbi:tetratricopeptide repeat protein, partial [Candidatus Sumerlaeota bacterium]|nr:tetratricopeptide repeat protein [Candidatus Sumerlaeota bacterium]
KAADAIEVVHAHMLQPHIASLAVHYRYGSGSKRVDKAIDYSIRAGEAAKSLYAWDECIGHWLPASALMEEHGYDLKRRAGLLEKLGIVALEGGLDYDQGFECLENALELYEASGDDQRVAKIHGRLGTYLVIHEAGSELRRRRTDIALAWEHFRAAEAILSKESEDAALGFVYQGMAVACWAEIQTEQGLSYARRSLEIADRLGHESLWVFATAALSGMHLFASGRLGDALETLERAREVAERLNLSYGAYLTAQFRGRCSCWLLDPRDAQSWWANELQSPRYTFRGSERRARLLNCLADACWMSGKLSEGARLEMEPFRKSRLSEPGDRRISRASGIDEKAGIHDADSIYYEPRIALWLGDWKRNEMVVNQRREEERRRGWRNLEGGYTAALARLRWRRGDLQQAETLFNEIIAMVAQAPHLPTEIRERSQLALLYAELNRNDDARPHLERCREILALGEDWRGLKGRVILAEAAVLAAQGKPSEAESEFEQAIDTFRRYTLPWDEAEAMQLWGRALRDSGKSQAAIEKFDAALAIYGKMGADKVWPDSIEADKQLVRT